MQPLELKQTLARTTRKLSIVIPAYNEEKNIERVIQEIETTFEGKEEYEIIVVDDGSKDSTATLAEENGVRVVHHPFNMGYGASLKSGIRTARYRNIILFDADDSFYPDDIFELLKYADGFDMVIGARTKKEGRSLSRTFLRWLFTKFSSFLVGRKFHDINSGFRLVRKDLALKLLDMLPEKFSFTTTLSVLSYKEGRSIVEVPIRVKKNSGNNKLRLIRDGVRFPYLALRISMYYDPFKVFSPLSFVLLVSGLLKSIYDIWTIGKIADSSILLFLSGIQLLVLALLGDLIVKSKTHE